MNAQQLINSHTSLVLYWVNKLICPNSDREKLILAGETDLAEAAKRFGPDIDAKFSTYATYWIKQSIRKELRNSEK